MAQLVCFGHWLHQAAQSWRKKKRTVYCNARIDSTPHLDELNHQIEQCPLLLSAKADYNGEKQQLTVKVSFLLKHFELRQLGRKFGEKKLRREKNLAEKN